MPKITAGGGASNVREELDPAVPTVTPPSAFDGPTVELTRDEDPNAPAPRPGEHVAFFTAGPALGGEVSKSGLNVIGETGPEELVDEPPAPRKAAKKVTRGPAV